MKPDIIRPLLSPALSLQRLSPLTSVVAFSFVENGAATTAGSCTDGAAQAGSSASTVGQEMLFSWYDHCRHRLGDALLRRARARHLPAGTGRRRCKSHSLTCPFPG